MDRTIVASSGNIGNHTFLQEVMPLKVVNSGTITEDINGQKKTVIRLAGRFQHGNKPNANGRIYETPILKSAVASIQEDIKNRRVLGELDHPSDAKIHLDRISHVITKLWMEGDEVLGELEIIDKTPCGSILKGLVESGLNIGISSRGVGDMEPVVVEGNEYNRVLDGFSFVTFDVVADPSVHGSYLSVMESKNRSMKKNNSIKNRERDILAEINSYLKNI